MIKDQLWRLFVCLFVIHVPFYTFKVHGMCIYELGAFLEFHAKKKISKNNRTQGKNVVLWVYFHPASTVKVKVK
jgi:hypothetical protein